MNAVEIEEAVSALADAAFDAAEFPYAFLAAFGNKETTLKRLRAGSNNNSDIPGAVLQRGNIHLAVCQPGEVTAKLDALRASLKTAALKAKFILATDGHTDRSRLNLVRLIHRRHRARENLGIAHRDQARHASAGRRGVLRPG